MQINQIEDITDEAMKEVSASAVRDFISNKITELAKEWKAEKEEKETKDTRKIRTGRKCATIKKEEVKNWVLYKKLEWIKKKSSKNLKTK